MRIAVVAVWLDGEWIVLDNRRLTLVADVDMRRIVPLFVFKNDGVEQFVSKTPPARVFTS
jgi:hypothetical protein